ncbi:hypothetical protein [Pyrobaculum aerophilum]|uniref:hypothetical protein n=1 Tax=Pyrobaculum aerophilum TaxID=13773 RepID=UPI0015F26B3C|nr:hypothetical protein [Pyrobaculum aerophilum]
MSSRRTYLKAIAAAATLGIALLGYWPVVDKIIKPKRTPYGHGSVIDVVRIPLYSLYYLHIAVFHHPGHYATTNVTSKTR